MAQEITFTKQADGTWQGSFTSTGTKTLLQVLREKNSPLYIYISADEGDHNVIYQPPKPAKDQILSIDIAEGALITIESHSEVTKAQYIASSLDYYTKDEIDDKMEQIHQFEPVVASSLPTASADTMYKFYFIPKQSSGEQTNTKEEWMTVKEGSTYRWEKIGETEVDLSDYVTVDDLEEYIENSKSFKGWFDDTTALSAAYPSPKVGDYAYIKGATTSDPAAIYECATAGTWSDSGRTVDTSSVQTFASGEEVNNVAIDDTQLVNPADGALPTAEDVMQLKAKLRGVMAEEIKVTTIEDWYPEGSSSGYYNTSKVWTTNSNFVSTRISVVGYDRVRFIGYNKSFTTKYAYGFLDNDSQPIGTFIEYYNSNISTIGKCELFIEIPEDATYFVCLRQAWSGSSAYQMFQASEFYCYLQKGSLSVSQDDVDEGVFSDTKTVASFASLGSVFDLVRKEQEQIRLLHTQQVNGFELDSSGNVISSGSSNTYVSVFDISDYKTNIFYARIYVRSSNTDGCGFAYYDENDVLIKGEYVGTGRTFNTILTNNIPSNAKYLKLSGYNSTGSNAVLFYFGHSDRSITPDIESGRLDSYGDIVNTFSYRNNRRTAKFIKVFNYTNIVFNSSLTCYARVFRYDGSYSFIDYVDVSLTSDVNTTVSTARACYIKVWFSMQANMGAEDRVPKFDFKITGNIPEIWDVKNLRPSDNGYQNILCEVNVLDANASNSDSNTLQDNPTIGYDQGLIVLPPSYSNEGEATRLIIYCHGAGVNYTTSDTRFPTTDLRPAYWLSEGYAVLDMDGEAAVIDMQHNVAPESLQCYIAGYEYAIRNYNIKTDGIFLGGRSMGGAMSMYIMQTDRIPVIANCQVVPVMNTLWWWNYCSAARKEYLATKCGFVGTPPTWTDGLTTDDEWQYLQDNFDALRRYSPLWSCITDLPDKDALFDERLHVSKRTLDVPYERELFGSLHAKVKAPVKFFDNDSDPTVPYERNAMLMYRMLLNSGCITELRMFDVSEDEDTSITAHHFELRTDRILPTFTNSKGEELQNVPIVYIEMLRFWQRYE